MYNNLISQTNILVNAFRKASGNQKPLTLEEYLLARKTVIEEQSLGIWDNVSEKENVETSKSISHIKESPQPLKLSSDKKENNNEINRIVDESFVEGNNSEQAKSGFDILHDLSDPWN